MGPSQRAAVLELRLLRFYQPHSIQSLLKSLNYYTLRNSFTPVLWVYQIHSYGVQIPPSVGHFFVLKVGCLLLAFLTHRLVIRHDVMHQAFSLVVSMLTVMAHRPTSSAVCIFQTTVEP